MQKFEEKLERSKGLAEIYELVKEAVCFAIKRERAGLMLGLADLGQQSGFFIGGFYAFGSNILVMNKRILNRILNTRPELFKPYAFYILLHEYLHSLGFLDEEGVRNLTYSISLKCFGEEHAVTQMAKDFSRFFPSIAFPDSNYSPPGEQIEIIKDFDKSYSAYIW